ncbi:hypothetical protein MKW92_027356, partial [Papaver armeniacum]
MVMSKLFALLLIWNCLIGVQSYHTISKEEKDVFGGDVDEQPSTLNMPAIKTFE